MQQYQSPHCTTIYKYIHTYRTYRTISIYVYLLMEILAHTNTQEDLTQICLIVRRRAASVAVAHLSQRCICHLHLIFSYTFSVYSTYTKLQFRYTQTHNIIPYLFIHTSLILDSYSERTHQRVLFRRKNISDGNFHTNILSGWHSTV